MRSGLATSAASLIESEDGQTRLKDTQANRALHPATTAQTTFQSERLAQEAFHSDESTLILEGDVRSALALLEEEGLEVDCIVTSPPFYGQRDYEHDEQLGLEDDPADFVKTLVEVFRACRPVLRETGSLWVNLGDTYWSGKGQHRSKEAKQGARRFGMRPQDKPGDGKWTRPKQLLLIPHRFAIAMQDDGWLVRNDNVWVKPNPIPDQVRDRCSVSHEYVFHFTRERWYFFDRDPVARPTSNGKQLPPLDTWQVPPSKGNGVHRAAFSEDLVKIPILSTTPPEGIVLDPFCGSGTSLAFARKQDFRSIGIDLKREFCELTLEAVRKADEEP
jgi:site-specific DNA-methyltransferase (cytosine-N4-specific)